MKKIFFVIALITVIYLTACGKIDNKFIAETLDTTKTEVTSTKETSSEITETTTQLANMEVFNYFGPDDNFEDVVLAGTISIVQDTSMEEKLQLLSNKISEECFDNLEIKIKVEDDTAFVNLIDDGKMESGWYQRLNGGSANAEITGKVIFNTLFQFEKSSNWIRNIQLLHNGEKMEEMDHFSDVGLITYEDYLRR